MTTNNSVPFDLPRERLNSGHTIRSLARELGMAQATLRRLEDGERIHPALAKKVADFFGVQVTDIWPDGHDDQEAA